MRKVRFPTIKILALILGFGLFAFLNETTVLTYPHYAAQAYIPDEPFALISVLAFLYILFAYLMVIRYIKIKSPLFIFVILLVGFVMIYGLFSHQNPYVFNVIDKDGNLLTLNFVVTRSLTLRSLFFIVSSLITTYLIIAIVPKLINSKRVIITVAYIFTFFILAMCVYSLIFEKEYYISFFSTWRFNKNLEIKALFSNKNVFGFYLFLALMYIAFIETIERRLYHYLIMTVLTFFIVMSLSKTVILSTLVFYAFYFIYDLFTLRKSSPKKFVVRGMILVISFFVFAAFIALSPSGFATSVREDILMYGIRTVESRIDIWKSALFLLKGERLYIGHGFGFANELLGFTLASIDGVPEATNRFHNGFLNVIASGGLVFFVAYLSFLIFVIYRAIKLWKVNSKYASTVLFMFIAYLIQGITESKVLFKADTMGLASTFILVVPVLLNPEYIRRDFLDETF